jgi:hypothetical protein
MGLAGRGVPVIDGLLAFTIVAIFMSCLICHNNSEERQ